MKTQKQVPVSAMSATFEPMHGGLNYGRCECPFCGTNIDLVGSASGPGIVWAEANGCEHHPMALAGAPGEIVTLFKG